MKTASGYRAWVAAAVLAAAIAAGWWFGREEPEPAPPPPQPTGTPAKPSPRMPLPVQHAAAENPAAENPASPEKVVDIFAPHTWQPPPPPMPVAGAPGVAPAPPQAPPLPFRFMGRIAEPGRAPVFLLVQGERVLPVKVGERIGGAYRLEKFEGGQLYFRYQPMNTVQTLPAGSAP